MLKKIKHFSKPQLGDTLVEVLIAIAVAAFAIGTSYAIANKSLQRAITARERNEALNYVEGQITALKIRLKADQTAFRDPANGFVVNSSDTSVGTKFHFCLDDQSNGKTDASHPWAPQANSFNDDSQPLTLTVGSPGYNANCVRSSTGTSYYLDVSAQITSTSLSLANKTVYRIIVRWPLVGSGGVGQSIIYYRL